MQFKLCQGCYEKVMIRLKQNLVQLKSLAGKPGKAALADKLVHCIEEAYTIIGGGDNNLRKQIVQARNDVTQVLDAGPEITLDAFSMDSAPPPPEMADPVAAATATQIAAPQAATAPEGVIVNAPEPSKGAKDLDPPVESMQADVPAPEIE